MNEESKIGYYPINYFPYYTNYGLSNSNAPGLHSSPLNQNMYNPNISYTGQNTIQNVNNMNNLNLSQLLIQINEMKKEIQDLKIK